jgi:hypothetical protein
MSLKEWRAKSAGWRARHFPRRANPMNRRELEQLMKAHPDGR